MKTELILFIEEGKAQRVEVKAYSKKSSSIYITAGSWQEVPGLIAQGQDLAAEACRNWKPEEEPAQDHTHTNTRAKEYEETPAGHRFTRRIENAKNFMFNHAGVFGGLNKNQLSYLADKHHNNLLNGSIDLMALAYKQGYNDGKAERTL